MYTEICAEPGEVIAATSSTRGIQFHLILSPLGKNDEKVSVDRRPDLSTGPSYFW
jgi:hypothetical protein